MRPVRVAISNVLLGDDYTGKLYVGAQQKEVNLLLDTGSSTLAVEQAQLRSAKRFQSACYESGSRGGLRRSKQLDRVGREDRRSRQVGRPFD